MGQVKFAGWHIDGFGVFSNYKVKNLSEQVTIFLGPNEAGKSTLLGFLRYMMFGFQAYSKSENRYPPLQGGRYGGRLNLLSDNGEYTIERYSTPKDSVTLWKPDGNQGTPQELAQLLGHADQQLYKSIFAFSLTELEDSKFQDSEQIHDRIVAGSLQGSKTSARDALKQLSEANAAIHKPRGRKTKLQELKDQISRCKQELDEAQKSMDGYTGLCREEAETEKHLRELGQVLGLEQTKHHRFRTLLDLWPQWCTRNKYHRELQALEPIDTFPLNSQERHTALCTSLDNLTEQATALRLKHEQLSRQKNELCLNPSLSEIHPQLLGLYERKPLYIAWSDSLQKSEFQGSQAKLELEKSFSLLGPGWNRERLSDYSVDLPQMEEIRNWGDRLNQANETCHLQEQRLQAARTRVDETLRQVKQTEERLREAGPEIHPEELDLQEESLTQLRIHLAEHKERTSQLSLLEDRLRASQTLSGQQNTPNLSRIRLVLWVLTALLLGSGALALVSGGFVWGLLMAIASIITLGLSLITPKGSAQGALNPEQKTELIALQKELQSLEARIRQEAIPFKKDDLPSLYETDIWVQRLARQREDAKSRKALAQDYKHSLNTLNECQQVIKEIEEELTSAQEQQKQQAANWNNWLEAHHIRTTSPQGAIDFLQAVKEAQKSLSAVEQAEETASELRQNLENYRIQLTQLLEQAEIELSDTDPLADLERLLLKDNANQEVLQRLGEIEKNHLDLNQQLESLANKREEAQAKLVGLYSEAGATTEEEFRHLLETFEKRQLLKQTLRETDMALEQRMGLGTSAEELAQMLNEGDVEGWEQAITLSEQARAELDQAREQALRRLGELGVERKKLEEASDINTLENQYQSLQETFARLTREWTVRAIAEGMIKETFQELEQTRQPAVLSHASELFAMVSGGNYKSVRQIDDAGIQVVSNDQKRVDPKVLSRGTAEQLYLCLRLGLIREFSQQTGGLPMVMDDVLVNFDPERTRNMVKGLCHFAEEQQILLFTCHPQTAELFTSMQNAQVIELPQLPVLVG